MRNPKYNSRNVASTEALPMSNLLKFSSGRLGEQVPSVCIGTSCYIEVLQYVYNCAPNQYILVYTQQLHILNLVYTEVDLLQLQYHNLPRWQVVQLLKYFLKFGYSLLVPLKLLDNNAPASTAISILVPLFRLVSNLVPLLRPELTPRKNLSLHEVSEPKTQQRDHHYFLF